MAPTSTLLQGWLRCLPPLAGHSAVGCNLNDRVRIAAFPRAVLSRWARYPQGVGVGSSSLGSWTASRGGRFIQVSTEWVQVVLLPCPPPWYKVCLSLCREWTLSWLQESQAALSVAVLPGGE